MERDLNMDGTEKRHCSDCRNYGALANQGYWWCDAGHTGDIDPEVCRDYYRVTGEVSATYSANTYVYQNIDE